MAEVYFFGCVGRPGHQLWAPGEMGVSARHVDQYEIDGWPWRWGELDCKYAPRGPRRDELGLATVTHYRGWTVLAMWDRSVDSRANCNAAFIARGEHTFSEMVALAGEHFGAIWERIDSQTIVPMQELTGPFQLGEPRRLRHG